MNTESISMTNGQCIDHLIKTNTPSYNVLKFLEELAEVNEALLKKITKEDTSKEPSKEHIIEELGDLEIRLQVLKRIYGEEEVNQRIQYKLDKYKQYIKDGKYVGRI